MKASSMTCEQVATEMVAWLYDELEGDLHGPFEAHLKACAACRTLLEQRRGVREKLDAWDVESPAAQPRPVANPIKARRPAKWFTSALIAASLFVACTLSFAHIEFGDGRLSISFGGARPKLPAPVAPVIHEAPKPMRLADLLGSPEVTAYVAKLLEEIDMRAEVRQGAMARAIESRLQYEQARMRSALQSVAMQLHANSMNIGRAAMGFAANLHSEQGASNGAVLQSYKDGE